MSVRRNRTSINIEPANVDQHLDFSTCKPIIVLEIPCIKSLLYRSKKVMYLTKNEGLQLSPRRRPSLALACPQHLRQFVIALSLTTILCLSLRLNSNSSCISIHEMWQKSWLSAAITAVIAAQPAKSRTIDLSSFAWTLSNPSLNISVPAKIPSQVTIVVLNCICKD